VKQENIDINLGSRFDAKGFKQAETATDKLVKGTKRLAGALGLAFGTQAIVNFGRLAVKASLDQQSEQNRLNKLLQVGVGATTQEIALLNEQTKALEKIGVVTGGNITQTQSQLATFNLQVSTIKTLTPAILDYVTAEKGATASTADFKSMTNGLAQALNGNFASLTRVGFVLDENTKKQIKSGTETERANALVKVLNSTYKDFNKNLRDTDAGQMQVLANAAQEATTIIGTGLIDAVKSLGDLDSVDNLAQEMQDFALYTADSIRGVGVLAGKLQKIPGIGGMGVSELVLLIPVLGSYLSLLAETGRSARSASESFNFASGGGAGTFSPDTASQARRQKKLDDDAKKRAQALAKIEKDRLKTAKEQTALQKAGTLFDIQQAGIIAALKGKITDEERTRLELQLAILTGNTSEASKLAGELAKSQGLSKELVAYLANLPNAKNPFSAWKSYLDAIEAQVRRIGNTPSGAQNFMGQSITPSQILSDPSEYADIVLADAERAAAMAEGVLKSLGIASPNTSPGMEVTVNVNAGSIIAQEQLNDVIRDSLLNDSLQAKLSAIFRQGGSFGP
jgi:hypothetical protein